MDPDGARLVDVPVVHPGHQLLQRHPGLQPGQARPQAEVAADAEAGQLHVLGPAPAPLGKLRGEYRAQLLIKGSSRRTMREALQRALASRTDLQRRVVVDVDPVAIL